MCTGNCAPTATRIRRDAVEKHKKQDPKWWTQIYLRVIMSPYARMCVGVRTHGWLTRVRSWHFEVTQCSPESPGVRPWDGDVKVNGSCKILSLSIKIRSKWLHITSDCTSLGCLDFACILNCCHDFRRTNGVPLFNFKMKNKGTSLAHVLCWWKGVEGSEGRECKGN